MPEGDVRALWERSVYTLGWARQFIESNDNIKSVQDSYYAA